MSGTVAKVLTSFLSILNQSLVIHSVGPCQLYSNNSGVAQTSMSVSLLPSNHYSFLYTYLVRPLCIISGVKIKNNPDVSMPDLVNDDNRFYFFVEEDRASDEQINAYSLDDMQFKEVSVTSM